MAQKSSTVGVRMSNEAIEYLKQKARKMSYENNKNISLSGLIKDAVEKIYPMPKKEKIK